MQFGQLKRREFITLLGGAAIAWPLAAHVQTRSLTVRGYIWREFAGQRDAFVQHVSTWIAEGRVRHREDVVKGLEKAPEAFIGMLEGRNFGKLLVAVGASG